MEIIKRNIHNMFTVILGVSLLFISACSTGKKVEADDQRKQRQLQNKTPTLNFEYKAPENIIKQGDFSKASATTVWSDDKKYRVSLYSNAFPIPMQKIHSWVVHIETADGKPLEKATIYIHGGMPAHRHGFPVKPRVKKNLGNGNYLIKGVKFSMMGDWEMRINIKELTKRDRAVFLIKM